MSEPGTFVGGFDNPTGRAAERYWEARWREEKAENDRLRVQVQELEVDLAAEKAFRRIAEARTVDGETAMDSARHRDEKAENERLRKALRDIATSGPWPENSDAEWLRESAEEALGPVGLVRV